MDDVSYSSCETAEGGAPQTCERRLCLYCTFSNFNATEFMQ